MKYFIQTFGCAQNSADSERIAGFYESRGYTAGKDFEDSDVVIINTCIVRKKAEDKVYGLVRNLKKIKKKNPNFKIIITGCLVGAANREPTGQRLKSLHKNLPDVDEFLPIEEVGFEYQAIRKDKKHAIVPISNGCNNFCTFCIVPFSRGRERSRDFADIISEIQHLAVEGYEEITLVGQNVNSYGSDLVKGKDDTRQGTSGDFTDVLPYELPDGTKVKPVMVKHLGRYRIPTLFPYLLNMIAKTEGIKKVSFTSSNPWDFSDELIDVIAENKNINREIHLPVQSGDDEVLKRMNRWYTQDEYVKLIEKIKNKIPEAQISTDVIVGFPGESEDAFENTVKLAEKIKFSRAFIARYSPRLGTAAQKTFPDDISHEEKLRRFVRLDTIINPHLRPKKK